MSENRTAGESLRFGERVKIGQDGRVYRAKDGKLQAYCESAEGYLVQVGPVTYDEPPDLPNPYVAPPPKDPPSRVESGQKGQRR